MAVAMLILFLAILACLLVAVIYALIDDARRDREAVARAEALLRTHLSETELGELKRSGVLRVASPQHAGRVYDVRANGGRVTVRNNGSPEFELCVHPREILPGREHVLAHKLMIEGAEDEYIRRANVVWRAGLSQPAETHAWWE
jgi:hypothetical protein